jgi:hypothetical protein
LWLVAFDPGQQPVEVCRVKVQSNGWAIWR